MVGYKIVKFFLYPFAPSPFEFGDHEISFKITKEFSVIDAKFLILKFENIQGCFRNVSVEPWKNDKTIKCIAPGAFILHRVMPQDTIIGLECCFEVDENLLASIQRKNTCDARIRTVERPVEQIIRDSESQRESRKFRFVIKRVATVPAPPCFTTYPFSSTVYEIRASVDAPPPSESGNSKSAPGPSGSGKVSDSKTVNSDANKLSNSGAASINDKNSKSNASGSSKIYNLRTPRDSEFSRISSEANNVELGGTETESVLGFLDAPDSPSHSDATGSLDVNIGSDSEMNPEEVNQHESSRAPESGPLHVDAATSPYSSPPPSPDSNPQNLNIMNPDANDSSSASSSDDDSDSDDAPPPLQKMVASSSSECSTSDEEEEEEEGPSAEKRPKMTINNV